MMVVVKRLQRMYMYPREVVLIGKSCQTVEPVSIVGARTRVPASHSMLQISRAPQRAQTRE